MKHRKLRAVLTFAVLLLGARAEASPPLLLRHPSLSSTQIAFSYGDDIWLVNREGGEAKRLVTGRGQLDFPFFSPDGKWIAYSNREAGNFDLFVVSAKGSEPKRLTYHPDDDVALGWTPDGKKIVFRSSRHNERDYTQLYTISPEGGAPEKIPLPNGGEASFSPDGSHIAYLPFLQWQHEWKRYRGGQTTRIWLANLADASIVKIPRTNSNDFSPMWVGDKVYFLSDRDGLTSLYSYDTKSAAVTRLVDNKDFDIKSAGAINDAIVYDQVDGLYLYDFKAAKARRVDVAINAELPRTRPRFEKMKSGQVLSSALSPNGKRALFEFHGEIISVPAEKGDARNLTQTTSVAERTPSWSPDSKWIAYLSDASGAYQLHLTPSDGKGEKKVIILPDSTAYVSNPQWSPDSTKIAYLDQNSSLNLIDVTTGTTVTQVDAGVGTTSPGFDNVPIEFHWSPDSKWLVFSKLLKNRFHGVFLYDLEAKVTHAVTDGVSDAYGAVFDRSGKYLYFHASTNSGVATSPGDISALNQNVSSFVYAAVLKADLPSPLVPQSDEDRPTPTPTPAALSISVGSSNTSIPAASAPSATPEAVKIDFEGLQQRIIALPLPEANYIDLSTGKADSLLALSIKPQQHAVDGPVSGELIRYDLTERKATTLAPDVTSFEVSASGEKLLVRRGDKWQIVAADKEIKAEGELKLDDIPVAVDPKAEWAQIYREAWRIERAFLYDPNAHGLNLRAAEELYRPYVDGLGSRSDLSSLLAEMTGWVTIGHMFVWGAPNPENEPLDVGLLGAEFSIKDGRYVFSRILEGENFNPDLQAPLTQPGVKVNKGDYLLAVNDVTVTTDVEVYRFFVKTAGKQTRLKIASKADGSDAHEEIVVPISSEDNLRYRTWIEANRKKVEALSGGKLGYVHIPDTGSSGLTNFHRYFFAQVGKQGVVLDERFNHGGFLADYIVDMLDRPVATYLKGRVGDPVAMPSAAVPGPKVMLINEMSGSGGDYLPWYFRLRKAGTLIGTRTWGGLVGIGGYPSLIDGGGVTAPETALMDTNGRMDVENIGVPPDIEVEQEPRLVREGRDPQLERAVALALEQLAKNPLPAYPKIHYPDYGSKLPPALRRK